MTRLPVTESDSASKQNITPTSGSKIDLSKRKLTQLGATAPILMTLASRPVLGAPCLSNMMSGDLYQDRGECLMGWSPGAWKNIGGAPNWGPTGYTTGRYDPNAFYTKQNGDPNKCGLNEQGKPAKKNENECYIGATLLSDTPLKGCFGGIHDTTSLFLLLDDYNGNNSNDGTFVGHFVCALLNAKYYEGQLPGYVLSAQQVVDICNKLPEYDWIYNEVGIGNFLASTWT